MSARSIQQWFDEYGESHRNDVNITVHWIAVPLIFFSVVGLISCIPPLLQTHDLGSLTVAGIALVAIFIFYMRLSLVLAFSMLIFASVCLGFAHWLNIHASWPLWAICMAVFIRAWAAQFLGHNIEGKRPSFLKDLQFLLIGPAWLLAKLLKKIGIRY